MTVQIDSRISEVLSSGALIVLYGPSGAGKTIAAATAVGREGLYIAHDRAGLRSVAAVLQAQPELLARVGFPRVVEVPRFRIDAGRQVPISATAAFRKLLENIRSTAKDRTFSTGGAKRYSWLVFDEWSFFVDRLLVDLAAEVGIRYGAHYVALGRFHADLAALASVTGIGIMLVCHQTDPIYYAAGGEDGAEVSPALRGQLQARGGPKAGSANSAATLASLSSVCAQIAVEPGTLGLDGNITAPVRVLLTDLDPRWTRKYRGTAPARLPIEIGKADLRSLLVASDYLA